ncbi:MAG: amino acid adenylation domain-containing protein, partial [bacterium]|nr:amino acid adenylation domain-containing protein [bacterium]
MTHTINEKKNDEKKNNHKKDNGNNDNVSPSAAGAAQGQKEQDYWLAQLSGDIVKSVFPIDNAKGIGDETIMKLHTFTLNPGVRSKLMQLSNQSDIRLFIILMTGLVLLFNKYTGNNDIIVGAPIYKQDIEGEFVNKTLVLRNRLKSGMTFKQLLLQVSRTNFEANENVNYPVETIPYELNMAFYEDEFPLLDTAILLKNIHDKSYISHLKLNVVFSFLKTGDEISGEIEYNAALYQKETIRRLALHLDSLLTKALSGLDDPVAGLSVLSEEEKQTMVTQFNDTPSDYPRHKTLHRLFLEQVEKTPQEVAVREGAETLTYSDLKENVNRLGMVLKEKGAGPGRITGILLERSADMVTSILAELSTGGAYLPIDIRHPAERIAYVLKDSAAGVLVSRPQYAGKIDFTGTLVEPAQTGHSSNGAAPEKESGDMAQENARENREEARATDPAYVIYTSGTGGKPKGVMLEHRSVVNYICWAAAVYVRGKQGFDFPLYSSISFDLTVTSVFTPLVTGNAIIVYKESGKELLIEKVLEENRVGVIKLTPSHLYVIKYKNISPPGISCIIVGGESLEREIAREIHDMWEGKVEIYNEYGPTEAAVGCSYFPFAPTPGGNAVPIGTPVSNAGMYLLDNQLNPVPVGVKGEIYVAGDGVARGYINQPELTAQKFMENPFVTGQRMYRTGDVARWLPEGDIEFLGRIDQQVKIRGYRIELEEIEGRLHSHPGISETVVIDRDGAEMNDTDEKKDRYLCAYIVARKKLGGGELREFLWQYIPDYMIPSFFVQLDRLPLTTNGKVDRKALPVPEIKSKQDYVAPRDEVENKLVVVWSKILGSPKETLSIDADFFEMGGQSLKQVKMIARVHKELEVKIAMAEIFKKPTIRLLAEYIRSTTKRKFSAIPTAPLQDFYPLSDAQKRIYILSKMDTQSTVYNVSSVMEMEGPLEIDRLENAFRQLIRRHESFRTSFHMINGEPVQKIHDEEVPTATGAEKFEIRYYDTGNLEQIADSFIAPYDLSEAPLLRVGLIKIEDPHQQELLDTKPRSPQNTVIPGDTYKQKKYVIIVDVHHIISDGTSMEILTKELMTLYKGEELPPLKLQYKDYTLWQNSGKLKKYLELQGAYWLREFERTPPLLNLPLDFTRPPVQSFEGKTLFFEITPGETAILKKITAAQGTTMYMLLSTIFYIFLSRISGQEDIVIGIPVARRRHANLENIIGMFVNTLALRNKPEGDKRFHYFLRDIKTGTLSAFDNQDYPLEELVEKSGVARDAARNPLFSVIFSLQDSVEIQVENTGLKLTPLRYEHNTSKFDLSLEVLESGKKTDFSFEYCTRLFKEKTVKRFILYFKAIIKEVTWNPSIKLKDIDILPVNEKEKLLYEFNDTTVDYPRDKTIHQMFEEQVERTPDRISIVGQEKPVGSRQYAVGKKKIKDNKKIEGKKEIKDSKEQFPQIGTPDHVVQDAATDVGGIHESSLQHTRQITYRKLNEKSNRLAHLLRGKGVKPGTIVAIMVERSIEMIIGLMGILKAGAAYLPIDPEYPKERIDYMLKDSNTRLLIKELQELRKFEGIVIIAINTIYQTFSSTETQHPASGLLASDIPQASGIAYVIYTSGSTGRPKGVLIRHTSVVNLAHSQARRFKIDTRERVMQFSSISFDASVEQIYISLFSGAVLVLVDKEILLGGDKFSDYMNKQAVTHLHAVPTFLNTLEPAKNRGLRRVIAGGEVCPPELPGRWHSQCDFYNEYGPTETTVTSIELLVKEAHLTTTTLTIGKPIDNTRVFILDKYRKLVPTGVIGELYIGGSGVAPGYLNNPELTAERFVNYKETAQNLQLIADREKINAVNNNEYNNQEAGSGSSTVSPNNQSPITGNHLYRTGDLARWLPGGNIEYLGRIDHQVKIRGFRIEPGEIENRLANHKDINEAVVVAVEEKNHEKNICAYWVSEKELSVSQLRDYLGEELPDYMIPTYFVRLPGLPMTPSAKVDRKRLPPPEVRGEGKTGDSAPGNRWQEILAAMWSDVLAIEKENIGIDDNFFLLGGHSMRVTQLAMLMTKKFAVDISMAAIFRNPTIRQLARYVQETTGMEYHAVEPTEKKEYYPLTSPQKQLYFLDTMQEAGIAYNTPAVLVMEGTPDKKKLADTFQRLLLRHDSLRTAFHIVGTGPVQKIEKTVPFHVHHYDPLPTPLSQGEIEGVIAGFIRPFDLSQAPLLRVGVHPMEEGKQLLMVDMHHIISDGVSMVILAEEFAKLYDGEILSPLNLQYKDYARWENSDKGKARFKRRETYWLKELAGQLPQLQLPVDYPGPRENSFKGHELSFEVDSQRTRQLENLAAQERATLYMVLLTIFNVFLNKLCDGQEDIVIGTVVEGRDHPDMERVIGMFVNSLVLRNYPTQKKTFNDFLCEVKERTLQAFENRDYPFEYLVAAKGGRKETGSNPLFNVGFTLQNFELHTGGMPVLEAEDISLKPFDFNQGISKNDLTLIVSPEGDGLKA